MSDPPSYPRELERDVILRDGARVSLRPIRPDDAPEVALVIPGAWQNRGLGTVLFQALLEAAQARGLFRFRAWVLADNVRMLDLINRYADVQERRRDGSVLELVFTSRARRPT